VSRSRGEKVGRRGLKLEGEEEKGKELLWLIALGEKRKRSTGRAAKKG